MLVVGPRLEYLRQYEPRALQRYALATILSRSDDEFVANCSSRPTEEYLVFKSKWLALVGGQLGMAGGRRGGGSAASARASGMGVRLAAEITDELWQD